MSNISTEEAKRLKIPGWDVYQSDHIIYLNEANIIGGALRLLRESYIIFNDSSIVAFQNQRKTEEEEWKAWIDVGGDLKNRDYPTSNVSTFQHERHHLDMFKIGTAFEIAIKANLLLEGFIVHRINKSSPTLFTEQRKSPLRISRLNEIGILLFNGERNYYSDLDERTLGFDNLLKEKYFQNALGLDDDAVQLINERRLKRNLIHMPTTGEQIKTPFIKSLGEKYNSFIYSLFNQYVVEKFNSHSKHMRMPQMLVI